ncbi:structural maintenance of chromosomes protein 5-like protein [Cinnamomum micranthum f. kanehirae]|uniref:Structural maintenance of chromosomes protein 5-like protein n=1 Tax=Cinnamomum micranthum f. kanehirae TaxID=337451 RepID=A0A443P1T6_9MAGN|nr:structural maintenance of chromosomes protein 5-like protein [Cinnamomum micranthum f. kanehirae]
MLLLRCFLLTPKLLSDMENSDACSILNILNGPCIEEPAKVTSKTRFQRRELSCHSSSSTAPPSPKPTQDRDPEVVCNLQGSHRSQVLRDPQQHGPWALN